MKEKILEIYTDASGDNKNGLGILFINPDETERQYSYKTNKQMFYELIQNKHRTPDNVKINTIQLEMMAIFVAIKELKTYSRTFDRIILYSDNLPCINYLNKQKNKKNGKKIKNSVIELSNVIKRLLLEDGINVEFRWIKSHCGVYGNEIADRLARVGSKSKIFFNKNIFQYHHIYKLLFENKTVVWRKAINSKIVNQEFETVYI